MDAVFNLQLAEKLSKLNNSQQSIESLSHWCINNRMKARQIVDIWEKLFNNSPIEQRVPFLNLANDILQNSRRQGCEFVNEFWKVLPSSLKGAYEKGEESLQKSVMRLVGIWDDRKVFGSRCRGLKDDIVGIPASFLPESNGKNSNGIKLVKKDAHSVRIKLAVGGMAEKIVTAYQAVLDGHLGEDTALSKCKSAVCALENMEKEANDACSQGSQHGLPLMNEFKEQEHVLKLCIQELGQVEATRASLVAQLKEALQEQESKLDLIRSQLQVAQIEADHTITMRHKLLSNTGTLPSFTSAEFVTMPAAPQVETSSLSSLTTAKNNHKKAAAAVAAKLAASTSSAQMLTSILSSLAAEEAASMTCQGSCFITTSAPIPPPEKRPKHEKIGPATDTSSNYLVLQHSQNTQPLPSFPALPSVPPPVMQPYMQNAGVLMNAMPFGFAGGPPPLPSVGITRLNAPILATFSSGFFGELSAAPRSHASDLI